jgi:dihydrofolate synthase/folylpolyglutamate synthase
MKTLSYDQAVEFMFNLQQMGWKLGLDRMLHILQETGNPHLQFPSVLIAGTNGKGSVTAMLESIFRHAGYRTAMYTSPHLVEVTERLRLDGKNLSRKKFASTVTYLKPLIERVGCSFFESMTTLAFLIFAEQSPEIAFIEVGLGGRFDATNVLNPLLSVITDVSYDHRNILGDTIAKIAFEKAGIIKEGVPCLTGDLPREAAAVIKDVCRQRKAPLYCANDLSRVNDIKMTRQGTFFRTRTENGEAKLSTPLIGRHQVGNSRISIAACHLLQNGRYRTGAQSIAMGLRRVRWPGRFQRISKDPLIIVDVAHNIASIEALRENLSLLYNDKKIILVLGILRDKDIREMLKIILTLAETTITVTPLSERALSAEMLAAEIASTGRQAHASASIKAGLEKALALYTPEKLICVTGSIFLAGEAIIEIKILTKKS